MKFSKNNDFTIFGIRKSSQKVSFLVKVMLAVGFLILLSLAFISRSMINPFFTLATANGDWAINNGHFYTQTANEQGGFAVIDDQEASFWRDYQNLGGIKALGYPISRRYYKHGFVRQAFQKGLLQWNADSGRALPINLFDYLSDNGYNQMLFERWQVPYPFARDDVDPAGGSWHDVVAARQAILQQHPALESYYFSFNDPIAIFGLPTSYVQDMGSHDAVRTQRALLQYWKEDTAWTSAGDVTVANSGEIAKELGWVSSDALFPQRDPTQPVAQIPDDAVESFSTTKLRDLAPSHNIRVGVSVNSGALHDTSYVNTLLNEFNSLTPEVEMKFDIIHPCPPLPLIDENHERYNSNVAYWVTQNGHCDGSEGSEWDWSGMDRIIAFAENNNMGVYGHTLSWHQNNPRWLTDTGLSREEREWVLQDHIKSVIYRYCSRPVYAYDVVNEALDVHGTNLRQTGPWFDIPDYIPKAFRFAREALNNCHSNPNSVKLFYNDWDVEYDRKNKAIATYNYFKELLSGSNRPPIDGIGFETHLRYGGRYPNQHNYEQMSNMMSLFANLGLEVKITEIDVPIFYDNPADYYEQQAAEFGGVAKACRNQSSCTGFTVWGLHDANSWRGAHRAALLFSDQLCGSRYCPKPAFFAVQDAWK